MDTNSSYTNSGISLEGLDHPSGKRPVLVNTNLVSEMHAESLLQPMDQVYSPSVHLHGILFIYRYILNATRMFSSNMRAHLPTSFEIEASLKNENYKFGDLKKILAYLTKSSSPNPPFCVEYFAAIISDDRLMLLPVYLCGNESVEKIIDHSDELSVRNIVEKAAVSRPWADRISHGEFLTAKIQENKIQDTYFLGYFKFDDEDKSKNCIEIYERRILPLIKGRSEILYLEIPRGFQSNEPEDQAIVLINDNQDIKFRYQFFSARLIAVAKKIISDENSEKNEALYTLRKAFEEVKKTKSPDTIKNLAAALNQISSISNTVRQMSLEIFLMRDKATEILRVEKEAKEARNKLYLDLLIKKVKARRWLIFIPASFYPSEIFEEALSAGDILGVRKSANDLGLAEDYYAMIETSLLGSLLKTGNWFELSIIEDILKASSLSSKDFYVKNLYSRKKSIIFMIINPFFYLFRMLFPGKKSFIEKTFEKEVTHRGRNFLKGMQGCLENSGIHLNMATSAAENRAEKSKSAQPTEKQLLTKRILEIMFPDPSPHALWINEIEYKEKLFKVAREIRKDPQFPQYADKSDEAIIADMQPFIKEELVENSYEGALPAGLDKRGKKFTRKLYFPKAIKDQKLVYNSIREELEHDTNSYGSRDWVEYHRAIARFFSESSMENIRSVERLKTEAEKKNTAMETNRVITREYSPKSGNKIQQRQNSPTPKTKIAKAVSRISSLISPGLKSNVSETPPVSKTWINGKSKIQRTAKTLALEMKDKYISSKKFSGSNLFPVTPSKMEELLDIDHGTLSMFSAENTKTFTDQFIVVKAGKQFYYFPKKFFASNKDKIEKFYEELIQRESGLPLPNGEILHKAQDLVSALKTKH